MALERSRVLTFFKPIYKQDICSAVALLAQPQYHITHLGTFQPNAIAREWVVGSENGLPHTLSRLTHVR
jgi:hypothetical protein